MGEFDNDNLMFVRMYDRDKFSQVFLKKGKNQGVIPITPTRWKVLYSMLHIRNNRSGIKDRRSKTRN